MLILCLLSSLYELGVVDTAMEAFVVGGEYTKIQQYPHSVFLNINCQDSYICGGSLVTDRLVLTAAHCLSACRSSRGDRIELKYGNEFLERMKSVVVARYVKHRHFDDETLECDIGMVFSKSPIPLGRLVKRVAILPRKPKQPAAGYMAGWGVINSEQEESTILKSTAQKFQSSDVCSLIGVLPQGTFCAGPIRGRGAPDQGDSGSAFVIHGYIQLGIVSYKNPKYSLVVYTNTTYHYHWIVNAAEKLTCSNN